MEELCKSEEIPVLATSLACFSSCCAISFFRSSKVGMQKELVSLSARPFRSSVSSRSMQDLTCQALNGPSFHAFRLAVRLSLHALHR